MDVCVIHGCVREEQLIFALECRSSSCCLCHACWSQFGVVILCKRSMGLVTPLVTSVAGAHGTVLVRSACRLGPLPIACAQFVTCCPMACFACQT